MKRIIKKTFSFVMAFVLSASVFFAVPAASSAISKPAELESSLLPVWVDPTNTLTQEEVDSFISDASKITMTGAVGIHNRSKGSEYYYLFLPSTADCNNLKVWFNAESVSVDGTELVNGEPTDVFSALNEGGIRRDYSLVIGSTTYNLVAVKSGDVGTIFIDTESGSINTINSSSDHSASEEGSIMVVNPSGKIEYDGVLAKFSGRGNATWNTNGNKNPYNIKLDKSTSLLGMPKNKKWALLANAYDEQTLIKNQLIYDFADYIGVKYQVHCKPVDVYVNQQYFGSYQLAERVEIKSNRINVKDSFEALEEANGTINEETGKLEAADFDLMENLETRVFNADGTQNTEELTNYILNIPYPNPNAYSHTVGTRKYSGTVENSEFTSLKEPDDITGGYLFELEISERWAAENAGLCAYNRQGWVIKSHDVVSKNMADYCFDLLYAMGSAVYNGGTVPSAETKTSCLSLTGERTVGAREITNPAPAEKYQGKRWSDILDADSAVKFYWTQELFKNLDSSTSSTYFYKNSDILDTKVYAGPAWDFDHSIGFDEPNSNRWGESLSSPEGWYAKKTRIYRWRTSDSSTNYSSDSQSPLGFYAALATNCSDFDIMAKSNWYSNIAPAIDVLLGNKTDEKGILKSTAEYANAVKKSGTMNNMRFEINSSSDYDAEYAATSINNWLTSRRTWINEQFGTVNISECTLDEIAPLTENGSALEPGVHLTYGGVDLTEGSDYSLEYLNNTEEGTATVIINGEGYYSGSRNTEFTIKHSDGPIVVNETIAAWEFDSEDESTLANADETGESYYYKATSGVKAAASKLFGSVDSTKSAPIAFSGSYTYVNMDSTLLFPVPIMGTDKTAGIAWGEYPYFETVISTRNYSDITFSAMLGGSNKGPRDWKLQYSLNGVDYFDVEGASYTIITNKRMEQAFDSVTLPDACANKAKVYIRAVACNDIAINGKDKIIASTSGDIAINNIVVNGNRLTSVTFEELDLNNDGVINAKDYALIIKTANDQQEALINAFRIYLNARQGE